MRVQDGMDNTLAKIPHYFKGVYKISETLFTVESANEEGKSMVLDRSALSKKMITIE